MITCIEMNNNENMLPRAYLWLRTLVADRSLCSTPESSLRRTTVAGSTEDPGDDSTDEDISDNTDWDDERSTLVNSDSDTDHAGDASTCSDGDDDTDSDSGTDDEVDAGRDNTGTLLWRHITFLIAPHQVLGEPNVLFAKVTIVHTKGEDNCPREYVSA